MNSDPITRFQDELDARGLGRPEIVADGEIHRFPHPGERAGKRSNWYVCHGDGVPSGAGGSWKTGIEFTWCARERDSMSESERAEYARRVKAAMEKADSERRKKRTDAAAEAARRWDGAAPLPPDPHPYLLKKGVWSHGEVRVEGDNLVLQIRHAGSDALQSLQLIDPTGGKRFLKGGAVAVGCIPVSGDRFTAPALVLCEGYATGCTLAEALEGRDVAVVAALDCGNLPKVAETLRSKRPEVRILIAGDNDHETATKGDGKNPGREAAEDAALLVGGATVFPPDLEGVSDFNDWANQWEMDPVKNALLTAMDSFKAQEPERQAGTDAAKTTGTTAPRARKARPPSVADRLIKIGKRAELFHDENMDGYASVSANGHLETYPIRAKGFRQWLEHQYYMETRKQPGAQGIQDALSGLEAAARFDGKRREVSFRVAGSDGCVFIDLCNESWEAVKVTRTGWEIQKQPEVRFIRRRGQMALPTPERGGSLELLRPFLNTDDDGFLLCLMWLVSATNPGGPFPILAVSGEQGSGKSTVSKVLKTVLDPSTAALRSMPREERDFAVFAKNAFVLGLDNLSGITAAMSDTICRVVYGHGFATRELFTNDDEAVFCGARPVIINGIEDLLHRPDLADRAVTVHCETIQEARRKEEKVFWSDFASKHPAILGALLDAVVVGLDRMPSLTVDRLPRMADAAKWVIACETALPWKEGRFLEVYRENIKVVRRSALEADDFAVILLQALEEKGKCEMTALEVLTEVNHRAGEATRKSRGWPENPKAASNRLKRLAPLLRSNGWTFSPVGHDPKSRRTLNLFTRTQEKEWGKYPSHPSHPSGNSEPTENAMGYKGEGCEGYAKDTEGYAKDTEGYAKDAKDTPFYPSEYPSGVTDCKQREAKDAKDTKDEITIHSLVLDSDGGNGKGDAPLALTPEQRSIWDACKPEGEP